MSKYKKVILELKQLGDTEEWIVAINSEDEQIRFWAINKKKELENLIKKIENL